LPGGSRGLGDVYKRQPPPIIYTKGFDIEDLERKE
jgi:hypothetical protein